MNDEMQFIDSCFIRDVYFELNMRIGLLREYVTYNNSNVYLYFPEFYSLPSENTSHLKSVRSNKRVSRDTLYRYENNQLIPELKFIFKRNGRRFDADKNIGLEEVYKSSRYIFAKYRTGGDFSAHFFCLDTKSGKNYHYKYGREELYGNERHTLIRPMSNDTEVFYYWQFPNSKDDPLNEPNPTLIFGRFKQ